MGRFPGFTSIVELGERLVALSIGQTQAQEAGYNLVRGVDPFGHVDFLFVPGDRDPIVIQREDKSIIPGIAAGVLTAVTLGGLGPLGFVLGGLYATGRFAGWYPQPLTGFDVGLTTGGLVQAAFQAQALYTDARKALKFLDGLLQHVDDVLDFPYRLWGAGGINVVLPGPG